jgi:hypothetical protein
LRLSMIAKSHEVDLVDTWRADSQSLSVARRARNYPMCKNATARDSDRINDAPSRRVIQNDSQALPISVDLRKIVLVAF